MKHVVKNCGEIGVVTDIDDVELPPNAWSRAKNIRFQRNYAETFDGHTEVNDPTGTGFYFQILQTTTDSFIVYPHDVDSSGAAEKIYSYSSSNTNITRAAGDYTGGADDLWNGCQLHQLVILNNGVDAPQVWTGSGLCTNMIYDGVTDWETRGYTAKVIRSYLKYLFALHTNDGTDYPHTVHWSNPADPGSAPDSWDYDSTTNDSGRYTLSDSPGYLLDAVPLGESLIIYKEDYVYSCVPSDDFYIFDFEPLFTDRGLFTTNCAIDIGGRHAVLGDGIFYVHSGGEPQNVLEGRNADALFSAIDEDNYKKTFLAHNKAKSEVWICYPSLGNSTCNQAYVWNYITGAWGKRALPNIHWAAPAIVEGTASLTWDDETSLQWNSETDKKWVQRSYSPIADTLAGIGDKIYKFDDGNQFDGVDVECYVERTGINLGGNDQKNRITAIYPVIEGGPVGIRVGHQSFLNGPVTWGNLKTFTPGEDYKVSCRATGVGHAVRFYTQDDVKWKLSSYEIHYVPAGRR